MAQIPRRLLVELTGELNALSSAGRQMVENAIARLVPAYSNEDGIVPPENIPLLRAEVLEVMDLVCGEMTDLSAARTADFYDDVRVLSEAKGSFRALAESGRVPVATEIAVNAIIKSYSELASLERLVRELADRVDYEVKIASNDCVADNAERDPAKPGYGRVPSGSETCGFCLMLASYGFYANSREAASHAHPNCDCRIVQSYDGMKIEGHDPDRMYERTNECIETLGGNEQIRLDWENLPAERKREYLERYGNSQSKAYGAYRNNRISSEISTRDSSWILGGDKKPVDYSLFSNKEKKKLTEAEIEGHELLSEKGFNVKAFPRDRRKPCIDLMISGEYWELKSPVGTGGRLRTRISEGVSKWDRLKAMGERCGNPKIVLDNRFSEMSDKTAEQILIECMGFHSESRFDEALFISKEGKMRRYKK